MGQSVNVILKLNIVNKTKSKSKDYNMVIRCFATIKNILVKEISQKLFSNAEIIDKDLKVELGQLIRVTNLNKRAQENEIYVSLQVENEDGENERCILFTEIETADMEKISASFLSSLICGRIYKCIIGRYQTNIIKVKNYTGEIKYFRIFIK